MVEAEDLPGDLLDTPPDIHDFDHNLDIVQDEMKVDLEDLLDEEGPSDVRVVEVDILHNFLGAACNHHLEVAVHTGRGEDSLVVDHIAHAGHNLGVLLGEGHSLQVVLDVEDNLILQVAVGQVENMQDNGLVDNQGSCHVAQLQVDSLAEAEADKVSLLVGGDRDRVSFHLDAALVDQNVVGAVPSEVLRHVVIVLALQNPVFVVKGHYQAVAERVLKNANAVAKPLEVGRLAAAVAVGLAKVLHLKQAVFETAVVPVHWTREVVQVDHLWVAEGVLDRMHLWAGLLAVHSEQD